MNARRVIRTHLRGEAAGVCGPALCGARCDHGLNFVNKFSPDVTCARCIKIDARRKDLAQRIERAMQKVRGERE
jgi:hypothetical protein